MEEETKKEECACEECKDEKCECEQCACDEVKATNNNLGQVSFIMGIISLVLTLLFGGGGGTAFLLAVAGIVTGAISNKRGDAKGKKGLTLSIVSIAIGIALVVLFVVLYIVLVVIGGLLPSLIGAK